MLVFMPFRIPSWVKNLLIMMPLLEIAGFVIVGAFLGLGLTLLLVLISTFAGMRILSSLGVRSLSMAQNAAPMDVSLRMLAGILLLLPGFITDLLGLLLLIPLVRRFILSYLKRSGQVVEPSQTESEVKKPHQPQVIEGECWKEE